MWRLVSDVSSPAELLAVPPIGDALTRMAVHAALFLYAVAGVLMSRLDRPGWAALTRPGRFARLAWSLGCLAYLLHVALAFHHFHGWSHAEAMRHVEAVSGFGPGLFVSYLFTLAWSVDVAWWWLSPATYADRPTWIGLAWHGFFAFVAFNATVVFEAGFIRVCGIVLFAVLAAALIFRRLVPQGELS
jgi:hypothetical protein